MLFQHERLVNLRPCHNVALTLVQRLRHWSYFKAISVQRVVFTVMDKSSGARAVHPMFTWAGALG